MMLLTMISSIGIMWAADISTNGLLWSGGLMILVAICGWRYPGSLQEYYRRDSHGLRIGWIK